MNDENIFGVHHTAISVRNLEQSLKFYTSLGFFETDHYISDSSDMHIVQLNLNGVGLEIFWYAVNSQLPTPIYEYANNPGEIGVKHLALHVRNVEEALMKLKKLNYANDNTEVHIARSLSNSRYFFVQDPDGMWVEFIEDKRSNYGN